jgi:mono/diheme cytochrome c family protein
MKVNYGKYIALAILIVVSGLVVACGGGSSASSGANTVAPPVFEPTPAPTKDPNAPTPTPAPTATAMPAATVVDSEPAEPSAEEQIAQGKLIFEKTAGGVGCALCHGMDAMGDLSQGAPSNLGASWETIEQALYDRPQMSFISLTRDEIKAVAAYLQWLEGQQ